MANNGIPSGGGSRGAGGANWTTMLTPPDWDVFRHAATLSLEEAIALSCNIWSIAACRDKHEPAEGYWKDNDEFRKRLAIAQLRLDEVQAYPISLFEKKPYEAGKWRVVLAEFRKWGERIGWTFPHQFPRNDADEAAAALAPALLGPSLITPSAIVTEAAPSAADPARDEAGPADHDDDEVTYERDEDIGGESLDDLFQQYQSRVRDCMERTGKAPPAVTTKGGEEGDREWGQANGIPRQTITEWRRTTLGPQRTGPR